MSSNAGFPPGISAGAPGRRILAYVIDSVIPALLLGGAGAAYVMVPSNDVRLVLAIAAGVLSIGWWVVLCWTQGTRGASPGMRLMQLEVVGVEHGRPIGWARAIIRLLILLGLGMTSIGLIIMVILLMLHPRRQGWHDLAARAVVINARQASPATSKFAGAGARRAVGPETNLPPGPGGVGQSGGYGGSAPYGGGPDDNRQGDQGFQGSGQQPGGFPGQQSGGFPGQQQGGFPTSAPSAGGPDRPTRDPFARPGGPAQPGGPMGHGAPPGGGPGAPGGPGTSGGAGSATGPMPTFGVAASQASPEEVESTRLVQRVGNQRKPDQGWYIVLGDGRQVDVESLVLIGRNPQPRAGEEGAELVKVSDTSRTVSKTHIAVGVDTRGAYVMDRGSTNGSAIATTTGKFEPCAPGDVVRVREGQVVSYGEQRFEVRRGFGN
ncbi:RDD family protein [Microlunatus sp. Y2014]|uniref:RDD family protein n=1 Tax=Microlunatus sp. Y2014 TaxID=3418488 RepID=UPI003DA75A21